MSGRIDPPPPPPDIESKKSPALIGLRKASNLSLMQKISCLATKIVSETLFVVNFFPLRRFGDALFAPNYSCDDLIVDIFISATRLVMASSPYLKMLTRTNVI